MPPNSTRHIQPPQIQLCRAEPTATPDALAEALEWCRKGPVTLIYAARDTDHSHALTLRDVLMETLTHEASDA